MKGVMRFQEKPKTLQGVVFGDFAIVEPYVLLLKSIASRSFKTLEKLKVFGVSIDKDHFSLVELQAYTKDLRYTKIIKFYCKRVCESEFIELTSYNQLLGVVADLKDSDEFDVYVVHRIDDLEFIPQPISLLVGLEGDLADEVRATHVGGDINTDENDTEEVPKEAATDLNGDQIDLNGDEINQNRDDPYFNVDEYIIASDETDDDVIPYLDDSKVDEELRSLRAENRSKKNPNLRKKENQNN
ncbi:hypothetical protein K7X08_008483 [Anisodus acutangulus]|uniref:Uncharacterized protein n=1 Tax=Anisodus acutangulus TaxID=402998 RepID=A0A9Q1MQG8_9SOLA|nr:hypothetical protein K7X08_008483 [Anisodus acutangulus]